MFFANQKLIANICADSFDIIWILLEKLEQEINVLVDVILCDVYELDDQLAKVCRPKSGDYFAPKCIHFRLGVVAIRLEQNLHLF